MKLWSRALAILEDNHGNESLRDNLVASEECVGVPEDMVPEVPYGQNV